MPAGDDNKRVSEGTGQTRSSLWGLVFAGSVLTSVLTFLAQNLAGPFVQAWVNQTMASRQAIVERSNRDVNAFLVEARGFDPIVASFVYALSQDNQVNQELRRNMATNLLRRAQLLEVAVRHLPAEARGEVKAYEEAIVALNNAIARIDDITSMREFWERASDMAVARSALIQRFERAVT